MALCPGVMLVAAVVAGTSPGELMARQQQRLHSTSALLFGQSPRSALLFRVAEGPDQAATTVTLAAEPQRSGRPGQGEAFLSSLVLPGFGQYRLGTRRWVAYAGLEALSAFLYLDNRAEARDLRAGYRDFAWEAARAGLSGEPRRDGDFIYYEALSKWRASGAWDADPNRAGVQPAGDPSTYNGSVWARAVEIFAIDPAAPDESPGFGRALDYYLENGYGPAFLWAWREDSGDRTRFGGLITSSDERFKDARRALGILVANHILSALDGLVTARLEVLPGTGAVGLNLSVSTPGDSTRR